MVTLLVVVAVAALAFLGWTLYGRLGADHLAAFEAKRRGTSQIVSRGEFVDGNRHLAVSLALTPSTFFYENTDMEACLDLEWVREIEYDNELATGGAVENGQVLRLRCSSQTFEFVLPPQSVAGWRQALPPRRSAEAGATMVSAT